MTTTTEDGRCPYVSMDPTYTQDRTRDDGWRCGKEAGHPDRHALYSADGDYTLMTNGQWARIVQDEPEPPSLRLVHTAPEIDLLTPIERQAMAEVTALWKTLTQVVGNAPTRSQDLTELIGPIHLIQRYVMAQAAGRAYPEQYRLLGTDWDEEGNVVG